jgi:hypothetical protein|tara:strand:- start:20001 stop:21668 length:1668 start_codon:yes stop_codon:yes gene_type:complete
MISRDEISRLKKRYITDADNIYSGVRKQQKEDQRYRDDTFAVDEIRTPHKIWRSGLGARMVDAPAEQIITSNPQAFIDITKGPKDASLRISEEVNQIWIDTLRRQNPNPFKEFVKNLLVRGEAFIKVLHNESRIKDKYGLPVLFIIPDPMVIYASPEEDANGIPELVMVYYERQLSELIVRYPGWTNPKARDPGKEKLATWFECWTRDSRYFEADGEPVLKGGVQANVYGVPPFVRKYSGFGRSSPDGKLEDLIVGDIRFARDLIKQECITRSNIASIEHIFAHRPKTILTDGTIDKAQLQEFDWGAYSLNVLENVSPNTKFVEDNYPHVPPEMYQNLSNIKAEIAQRNPFIMAGFPFGSSGRQQDMTSTAAMRRYDSVVENTENAFATSFEMALKICDIVPTLKPDGLRKSDLKTAYKCQVKLKARDPIEEDRKATLGSRLLANNEIDPETNLTQFKGYTADEARKILINVLKWKVLLGSPDIAELIGLRAAEKSGMAEDLRSIQAKRKQLEAQVPRTTQERIQGEVQTEIGMEQAPQAPVGARRPPERYVRGQ